MLSYRLTVNYLCTASIYKKMYIYIFYFCFCFYFLSFSFAGSAQENGVLTLNNIQPSFAGSYVCTGITPNGDRGTGTTTLTVRPEIESKYN